MTRSVVAALGLVAVVSTGSPARAEIGTPDVVPAATLLLPYFEVDLTSPSGATTLLSINNASAEVVLAFVTVWSEWWVPVLGFNVYLTGYDVATINLRDVVVNGDLPNTGPSNTLSPLGDFSAGAHTSFGASCSASLGSAPNYENLSPAFREVVQQALSGQPRAADGLCASPPGHPGVARGFVTIDTVRACTQEFPSDVGYFVDGGAGTATNQNVLWGDYFLVDTARNFAQGFSLVHIEADGDSLGVADNACDSTDRFPSTFYCTLRNPAGQRGEDNREALPSVYATRYEVSGFDGGVFPGSRRRGTGEVGTPPGQIGHADLPAAGSARPPATVAPGVEGTDLLVWRDKNGLGAGSFRECDDPPAPLGQVQIVAFDEEENPLTSLSGATPFPLGTNRTRVGEGVAVGADRGWLFMNLAGGSAPQFQQAFVTTVMAAEGRFSVGFEAISLNSLTLGADNRRGLRALNPTLEPPPNPNPPTLFGP